MSKLFLFVVLFTLPGLHLLQAQTAPSSWSIDLQGGATFGHFTHKSAITPHGEINFRYSRNPVVSMYANFGVGQFKSSGDYSSGLYENNYLTYGVGMRANILRMLAGPQPLTQSIGLFTLAGFNLIRNDVDNFDSARSGYPSQSYTGHAVLVKLGGGLVYKLGRRTDLFLQVVMNVSDSDLLDGHERGSGSPAKGFLADSDAFLNTSAGLSFKFGSSSVSHADWYENDHRIDPLAQVMEETLRRLEIEMDLTHNSLNNQKEQVQMFEQSLEDLRHIVTSIHSEQLLEYQGQIEGLRTRLQLLQAQLEQPTQQNVTRTVDTDEKQYFVVAGVFRTMDRAEMLLNDIRNRGYNEAEIIRYRDRNYFLVNYSGHVTEAEAATELDRILREENPESWIYIR